MQTIKALQRLMFLLVVGALLLPSGAVALDRVRVSYSASNSTQAFLWVAQEKGFFAKHGLEGELLYINSGSMNIAALVGGSVQVAGGGPVSIEARLRGVKLLILGNPLPWLASNLVTAPTSRVFPTSPANLPVFPALVPPPTRAFAISFARTV